MSDPVLALSGIAKTYNQGLPGEIRVLRMPSTRCLDLNIRPHGHLGRPTALCIGMGHGDDRAFGVHGMDPCTGHWTRPIGHRAADLTGSLASTDRGSTPRNNHSYKNSRQGIAHSN